MLFTIKHDGGFIAHAYGDRIDIPQDDNGCYFVYMGDSLVAGVGSRNIGVRVFGVYGEILPYKSPVIEMADFYSVSRNADACAAVETLSRKLNTIPGKIDETDMQWAKEEIAKRKPR